MIFILTFVVLVPIAGAVVSWWLLRRLSPPLVWLAGMLTGVAPAIFFTNVLLGSAGANDDPDPLLFQKIAIGAAALVVLLTLAALQFAARRSE